MRIIHSPLTALIRPTDSRFYALVAALCVEIETGAYNGLRSARGDVFLQSLFFVPQPR